MRFRFRWCNWPHSSSASVSLFIFFLHRLASLCFLTLSPPVLAMAPAAATKPRKSKDGAKKASGRKSNQSAEATPVKVEEDLIAEHVSPAQATKAFSALLAYQLKAMSEGEGANDLLAGGPESPEELRDGDVSDKKLSVYVNAALKEGGAEKRLKPYRIPLAHSLAGSGSGKRTVCLITPDPQRWWKDTLAERGVTVVDRVVGVTKLEGKFKPYDARRQLMNDYDLFLADDRLTPILPRLLGSKFIDSKKQPLLLNLRNPAHIKAKLEEAVAGTSFIPTRGVNASVRIGHLRAHTPEQLAENLRTALPAIIGKIPGGWSNIQAVDVKLAQSVALPVWNCVLGAAPTKDVKSKGENAWRWNLNGAELENARAGGAARATEWADTQTAALLQAAEEIGNPDFDPETLTGKRKRANAETELPSKKATAKKEDKKSKSQKDAQIHAAAAAAAEEGSDSSLTDPEPDAAAELSGEKSPTPSMPSKPSKKASKGTGKGKVQKAMPPAANETAPPAPATSTKAKGKKGKKA